MLRTKKIPTLATDIFPTSEHVERLAAKKAWFAKLDEVIARCERGDGAITRDEARAEMAALYVEATRLGI